MTGSDRIKVDAGMGTIWFIGWLFTIAYAKLGFWTAVLGLFIWPYQLGMVVR
jgi:hypothetical protein